jgi:hypothetical protein
VGSKDDESQFTKVIPGGMELTFLSIRKHDETFDVTCEIKTTKDGVFSIDYGTSVFKDANDVTIDARVDWQLYSDRSPHVINGERRKKIGAGVYINGKPQDSIEAKAGEVYKVVLRYWVLPNYTLTPEFPSVGISVNGLVTEFKDIPIAW